MKDLLFKITLCVFILCLTGCGNKSIQSSSGEMLTTSPTFSTENEAYEYYAQEANESQLYSLSEPEIFARPANIPDGYSLGKVDFSEGSENVAPAFFYTYYSNEFIEYDAGVHWQDLNTSETDQAYHDYKRQNTYYFAWGNVTTTISSDTPFIRQNALIESTLYPDVYITDNSPQIQKLSKMIAWTDQYGNLCSLQMPYSMFSEENIPFYTELNYYTINENAQAVPYGE